MYHWIGPGQNLDVGSFHLESPLIYASRSETSDEPSAVLLPLPVESLSAPDRELQASRSVRLHAEHGSFTSYAKMSPSARGEYLDWLAAGRPPTVSETLLAFYLNGLERRAIDHPEDGGLIWAELWRLADGNGEANPLFMRQVSRLQWFLFPTVAAEVTEEQARALATRTVSTEAWYEESQTQLSLLLFWAAGGPQALPPWLAYTAAHTAPEARRRLVADLAKPELESLFAIRFREKYGEHLPFDTLPEATRTLTYRPGNSSMNPRTITWPDALRLANNWRILRPEFVQIYEGCQSELLRFARLLRKGVDRTAPAGWEALPAVLRQSEHPFLQQLNALFVNSFAATGHAAIEIGRLALLFDSQPYDRVSPARSRRLVESLELCGLGIEPEFRYAGRAYRPGQIVMVFPFPEGITRLELTRDDAASYLASSFFLKVCFYVAKAGGSVSRDRVATIATAGRKLFNPGPLQRRQAKAQAAMLLARDFDLRGEIIHEYKHKEVRAALDELLWPLAAGEGGLIEEAAERALNAAWSRLGYTSAGVKTQRESVVARGGAFAERALEDGDYGGQGERTASSHTSIPFVIDYEALATLLEETRHVQRALAAAMDAETSAAALAPLPNPETPPEPPTAIAPHAPTPTVTAQPPPASLSHAAASAPPPRYASLYADLVARDRWPMQEAEALARSHKLMLAGALEAINTWAFDELGEQLLWDDGDELVIERELIEGHTQ